MSVLEINLFVILIFFHHTSEIFKWCFQRDTFTLFSSVRETINFVFSWPEMVGELELTLTRLSIKI